MGCTVSNPGGCNAIDAAMLLYAGSARTAAAKAQQRKELDLLWKLTNGTVWDTQTDTQAAYRKTVPSGAVAAEIGSIGGKSFRWNQLIDPNHAINPSGTKRAEVTLTYSGDGHFYLNGTAAGGGADFNILSIPSGRIGNMFLLYGAPASSVFGTNYAFYSSYTDESGTRKYNSANKIFRLMSNASPFNLFVWAGTVCNNVDFRLRLIDLTDIFGAGNEPQSMSDPRITDIIAYAEAHPEYDTGSLLTAAVTSVVSKGADAETIDTLVIPAAVRALEGYGQSAIGGIGNTLNLADGTYTEIGRYVDGVWTALDTPVVTDVSGLLAGTTVDTEAGGTLTFVQAGGVALEVPNSVDYLIKLTEVTL